MKLDPTGDAAAPPRLIPTRPGDSLAWMRRDVLVRLLPFSAAVAVAGWIGRPAWLGLGPGRLGAQLVFGIAGACAYFVFACLLQLVLSRRRGTLRVPASGADAALQASFYLVNAPVEEAFFRGLLQGGLGALLSPPVGLAVGTALYVLYHRLGRWAWLDVLATALIGIPMGLAFWLLPGPPSLLGVTLAHFGATCGFLGPGPGLLRSLGLLESRP